MLLILIQRGWGNRLWIVFGLFAGLGLLNKPSMTFFLIALLLGAPLTPQRRLLFNRWAAVGIALMILIALPNLLWQIHNHWPTLEFLHNGQVENKNIKLAPLPFLGQANPEPAARSTFLIWEHRPHLAAAQPTGQSPGAGSASPISSSSPS